jgi:hypothetical protein
MQKIISRLTVFFDEPFWKAVYERVSDGELTVTKITFGREPKDCEVYEFFLKNWHSLIFSSPVSVKQEAETMINPKRRQRKVKDQIQNKGVGTKSQQALKCQQDEGKKASIVKKREQHDEKELRKFELRQQKKKEKHRGH